MGSTEDHIDWANLSQEDKDEFFSWLDEFFSRYLNIGLPPTREVPLVGMKASASGPPVRNSTYDVIFSDADVVPLAQ